MHVPMTKEDKEEYGYMTSSKIELELNTTS